MQNLEFKVYSFDELSKQKLYDILAHRAEVFILGQRAIYRDLDGFDQKARHMVALRGGKIVGYVRLLPAGLHYDGYEENVFGRLSVLESERGQGLGAELVRRACAWGYAGGSNLCYGLSGRVLRQAGLCARVGCV